jgi:preprotein translocase subunit SecG
MRSKDRMISLIVTIHIIVCISLVVVVLLQQGKGAEVGAVFGGSSSTVFGASGAGNVLTRVTSALAVVFFATSMYLAYASTQRATGSIFGAGGAASSVMPKRQTAPANKPAVPAPASKAGGSPPAAPASKK